MAFYNPERAAAAGSSATRYKIARHLHGAGIEVRSGSGSPPSDDDFLTAIFDYFQTDPKVITFKRRHDKIAIPVPRSVLDWLTEVPARKYPVFGTEIVSGYYKGYCSMFYLSWTGEGEFILCQEVDGGGTYVHDFEWGEELE